MNNNYLKSLVHQQGFDLIKTTATYTSTYSQLYALTDTTFTTLHFNGVDVSSDFSGVTLAKGQHLDGLWTTVKLASGQVMAYKY